jgi:DNA mismatch endonuclease, patch repair protein
VENSCCKSTLATGKLGMVDRVTPARRSAIMATVKSKNTGPELAVRRYLHRLGYRYRLHRRDLPGSPDIVFPSRKKAILIHGCYWHGHRCRWGQLPKSKLDYWRPKIDANRKRDRRKLRTLRGLGWKVLVIWQCELRNFEAVDRKLAKFLGPS